MSLVDGLRARDAVQVSPNPRARRAHRWGGYAAQLSLLAVVYYLGARLGGLQEVTAAPVTPMWPPTGVAVLALLTGGPRLWPGITLGSLLVNLTDAPLTWWNLVICVVGTGGPLLAYYLLRRADLQLELDRTRDALALVFVGAFAGMLPGSLLGSGSLLLAGVITPAEWLPTWAVWWTGEAMGVLVLVPFGLAMRGLGPLGERWRATTGRRALEAAALIVTTVGLMMVTSGTKARLMFLIFPLLIWGALRFQHRGAAPCALIATVFASRAAVLSAGPFAGLENAQQNMLGLQAYNGTVALTGLVLAAVIAERDAGRVAIERTVEQLSAVVTSYQPLRLSGGIADERRDGRGVRGGRSGGGSGSGRSDRAGLTGGNGQAGPAVGNGGAVLPGQAGAPGQTRNPGQAGASGQTGNPGQTDVPGQPGPADGSDRAGSPADRPGEGGRSDRAGRPGLDGR